MDDKGSDCEDDEGSGTVWKTKDEDGEDALQASREKVLLAGKTPVACQPGLADLALA